MIHIRKKIKTLIHHLLNIKVYLNNDIQISGYFKNLKIKINGFNNQIIIQDGVQLNSVFVNIKGNDHKLIIMNNVSIKKGQFVFEDSNCTIKIGPDSTAEDFHLAATENHQIIETGKDCMFSYGVTIRTSDSHSIIDLESGKRINYAHDVKIGDHVWIGADVAILKGVKIGDNSIIGIKSVVTKDIPENVVAAGIPAIVIKENVSWVRKRI